MGVGMADGDSSGEAERLDEADSSGSTLVKYGEPSGASYQFGAASSFFNVLPRGSTLQDSRTLLDFSRVKTIMPPSGAKTGAESCPESSFVNCRSNFPSSRYRQRWELLISSACR